jgi:hypothetical protein
MPINSLTKGTVGIPRLNQGGTCSSHGFRTRIVVVAAGHPAADHHPASDLLASLGRLLINRIGQRSLSGADIVATRRDFAWSPIGGILWRRQRSRRRSNPAVHLQSPIELMVCPTSRIRDVNPTEAGRSVLAAMPETTRYKHKEGRHLCTKIPR